MTELALPPPRQRLAAAAESVAMAPVSGVGTYYPQW